MRTLWGRALFVCGKHLAYLTQNFLAQHLLLHQPLGTSRIHLRQKTIPLHVAEQIFNAHPDLAMSRHIGNLGKRDMGIRWEGSGLRWRPNATQFQSVAVGIIVEYRVEGGHGSDVLRNRRRPGILTREALQEV